MKNAEKRTYRVTIKFGAVFVFAHYSAISQPNLDPNMAFDSSRDFASCLLNGIFGFGSLFGYDKQVKSPSLKCVLLEMATTLFY